MHIWVACVGLPNLEAGLRIAAGSNGPLFHSPLPIYSPRVPCCHPLPPTPALLNTILPVLAGVAAGSITGRQVHFVVLALESMQMSLTAQLQARAGGLKLCKTKLGLGCKYTPRLMPMRTESSAYPFNCKSESQSPNGKYPQRKSLPLRLGILSLLKVWQFYIPPLKGAFHFNKRILISLQASSSFQTPFCWDFSDPKVTALSKSWETEGETDNYRWVKFQKETTCRHSASI